MAWKQSLKILVEDLETRGMIRLKLLRETEEFRTCLFDDDDEDVRASLLCLAAEGEPIAKRLKVSPIEHQPLETVDPAEAAAAEESRYIGKLLATPRELPMGVTELREFLSLEQTEKLPICTVKTYNLVNQPQLLKVASPVERSVAVIIESALLNSMLHPCDEEDQSLEVADSAHILRILTGDLLCQLNVLAPKEQQIADLEGADTSCRVPHYNTSSPPLDLDRERPDYSLYLRRALVLRWEVRRDPEEFVSAMEDNASKMTAWNPLFYGELPYVIGGCCAGRSFQWLKLSPIGMGITSDVVSEPISQVYDLKTLSGVASFLHSVVQMHRLLQRLQQHLVKNIPFRLYKAYRRPYI